jgi:tRNA 2-thiouridine synthesizing protein C
MTDNNPESTARKSVLFLFTASPQRGTAARDGIDTLLAYAAFEQPVAVLFHGEGIWQLLPDQQPELAGRKSIYKALTALPMYDVNHIYIHERSLRQRGVQPRQISFDNAHYVSDDDMRALLRQHSLVLRF